jgi:triphosphoribosyl-dephospho-CoA synthase
MACLFEASAPKAGNVHPAASFDDMRYEHFVVSSCLIGPILAGATQKEVGELVLEAVRETRAAVARNTNLGTLLLLSPLAKAACVQVSGSLQARTSQVLRSLKPSDSRQIYQAISLAQPGGMGRRDKHDLSNMPPEDILSAMSEVATFDAVARQYTTDFADVFQRLVPWFHEELERRSDVCEAICHLQLRWLAHEPDGLIVRKLGAEFGEAIRGRAHAVLKDVANVESRLADHPSSLAFDNYLRADGHRRNPGTTADLISATLFVCLLED